MKSKSRDLSKKRISAEKYILMLLIIFYFTGICSGCYFSFYNLDNIGYINCLDKSFFKTITLFLTALLLKYSGILSGIIYLLPFFSGIANSADYCRCITDAKGVSYKIIFDILKDTAVVLLLILYVILIINQLLHNKHNIKKDLKYLGVYIIGVVIIYITEYLLGGFVF